MTSRTIRHVLKATEVILDNPLQLSVDPSPTTCCSKSRSTSGSAVARITQSHAEYAVIEITCACGQTTQVRCDYVTGTPAAARQEPAA